MQQCSAYLPFHRLLLRHRGQQRSFCLTRPYSSFMVRVFLFLCYRWYTAWKAGCVLNHFTQTAALAAMTMALRRVLFNDPAIVAENTFSYSEGWLRRRNSQSLASFVYLCDAELHPPLDVRRERGDQQSVSHTARRPLQNDHAGPFEFWSERKSLGASLDSGKETSRATIS